MNTATLKSALLFIVLALFTARTGAVQFIGAAYCNNSDCTQNLVAATGQLNTCYLSCNPCIPTQCQYQYFEYNGPLLSQYLYGNDATCTFPNVTIFKNYSCGVCDTDLYPLAGFSLYFSCASALATTITGTASCGANDCITNQTSVTQNYTTNACFLGCNPCNKSMCQYQTMEVINGTVHQFGYGNDNTCSVKQPGALNHTYTCNTCDTTFYDASSNYLAVQINCDSVAVAETVSLTSNPIVRAAIIGNANANPAIPAGTSVSSITQATQQATGEAKMTATVNFPSAPTQSQIDAVISVIQTELSKVLNILPITRITIVQAILPKKRAATDFVITIAPAASITTSASGTSSAATSAAATSAAGTSSAATSAAGTSTSTSSVVTTPTPSSTTAGSSVIYGSVIMMICYLLVLLF